MEPSKTKTYDFFRLKESQKKAGKKFLGLISIQVSSEASTLSFMMSSISLSSVTSLLEPELPNFFYKGPTFGKKFFSEEQTGPTQFF